MAGVRWQPAGHRMLRGSYGRQTRGWTAAFPLADSNFGPQPRRAQGAGQQPPRLQRSWMPRAELHPPRTLLRTAQPVVLAAGLDAGRSLPISSVASVDIHACSVPEPPSGLLESPCARVSAAGAFFSPCFHVETEPCLADHLCALCSMAAASGDQLGPLSALGPVPCPSRVRR